MQVFHISHLNIKGGAYCLDCKNEWRVIFGLLHINQGNIFVYIQQCHSMGTYMLNVLSKMYYLTRLEETTSLLLLYIISQTEFKHSGLEIF